MELIKNLLTMLQEDVSDEQVMSRFLAISHDLPHGDQSAQVVNYQKAHLVANSLIKRFPEVAYSGRMFRGIELNAKIAARYKSPAALMKGIQETASTRASGISSWSETLDGCIEYLNYTRPGFDMVGYSDSYAVRKKTSKNRLRVIVIYEQQGTGVSYKALTKVADEMGDLGDKYAHMLSMTGSVGEVFAPHEQNARLGLIILEGLGEKRKQTDMETKYDPETTHWAHRSMFKPGDYVLYLQALEKNMSGEKIRALHQKIKPIHTKSQYNKDKTDSLSTETSWEQAQQDNEAEYGIRQPRFSG